MMTMVFECCAAHDEDCVLNKGVDVQKKTLEIQAVGLEQNQGSLGLLLDARQWARIHFSGADLKDPRRNRRLLEVAQKMMENPGMSLPKQFSDWSDLMGAYRFLSNDQIDPEAILEPHRKRTVRLAQEHSVVLCIQDTTNLDFTMRSGVKDLGIIGNGQGRGLLQHTALAVLPPSFPSSSCPCSQRLLGILDLQIQKNQLDKASDIKRLASIVSVMALSLLELRDLAQSDSKQADDPQKLQEKVPMMLILIVAGLSGADAQKLSAEKFWLAIAGHGGYLARKNDPRPGWKVLWRGLAQILQMAQGAILYQQLLKNKNSCV